MPLNAREWGSGSETALLLHGMMGSSESWWRVAPVLAARGYRVLALDLPGHGLSRPDARLTVERAAADVVEAAAALGAARPALAIGHSFGGLVLAAAARDLAPKRAIYVDSPFTSGAAEDRDAAREEYERRRHERTFTALRASRPHYSDVDCEVEGRAAEAFDADTAAGLAAAAGGSWAPTAGSLVIRADPSGYVSTDDVARLERSGVTVRSFPGAAHSIWYSHFDEFMSAIE